MKTILLPGLDGTGDLFQALVACTPPDVDAQIVPYPPDEPLTYEACIKHVLGTVSGVSDFVIVAESFSGPVAVGVAKSMPEGLRGIVLCNTFVTAPVWTGLRVLPWEQLVKFPKTRSTVGRFLTGSKHLDMLFDDIRAANQKVRPSVLACRMREILAVDVRRTFAALTVPVMYLRGIQDRLIGRRSLMEAMQCNPEMSVVELPGPHLLLQVEPERCWQEISGFVAAKCAV